MPQVITAHEATIQTATVEIQTMKVGRKQVTMAMFRQLPYRQIIDESALFFFAGLGPLEDHQYFERLLHGTPWGHVNYWWDGVDIPDQLYACRGEHNGYPIYDRGAIHRHGEKRHIVWQCPSDDTAVLYRSIVCQHAPEVVLEQYMNKAKMRDLWAPCWEMLCDLPQLFIAV